MNFRHLLSCDTIGGDGRAAQPREKREKEENSEGLDTPYLVPAHLSKLIKFCRMTFSHVSGKCKGFLSQLWRRELTLQNDANRAVCLRNN